MKRALVVLCSSLLACVGATEPAGPPAEPPARLRASGDVDHDGVPDLHDRCPERAGPKPHGCPEGQVDQTPAPTPGDAPIAAAPAPAEGSCTHAGRVYAHGERLAVDCNTCVCEHGRLRNCTLKACTSTIAERVWFEQDSVDLDGESLATLDKVAATLRANPRLRLSIEGRADSSEGVGDRATALASARATTVQRALRDLGVDEHALLGVQALGDTRPLGSAPADNRVVTFRTVSAPR